MKRFYKTVVAAAREEGHAVLLDGKAVKTPGKRPLAVPAPALGAAIAEEWSAQGETVRPETMPFTRFANTVLDGIEPDPSGVAEAVAGIFGSDLLCYRAEEPEALIARQAEEWDPVLAWAREAWSLDVAVTSGVMPLRQPESAMRAVWAWLDGLDPYRLGAAHMAATLTGSGVLTLALAEGHVNADRAWALSRIDEDWQISLWGEDEEATERAALRKGELDVAARVFEWVGDVAA